LKFHAGLMARDQGSVLANRHGIATLLTIISILPSQRNMTVPVNRR
jgi:hypothetical protein